MDVLFDCPENIKFPNNYSSIVINTSIDADAPVKTEVIQLLAEYPFDIFTPLKKETRNLFWENRWALTKYPECLPKILASNDWNSSEVIKEMYR